MGIDPDTHGVSLVDNLFGYMARSSHWETALWPDDHP